MQLLKQSSAEERGTNTPREFLTPREREVASLIALGHTNAEIARSLEITAKTIESHRKNIMTKLGLRNRADLVRFALQNQLIGNRQGNSFFEQCPRCKVLWRARGEFLSDPEVKFVGYQPTPAADSAGPLLFIHHRCGYALPLAPQAFVELTEEPIFATSCTVTGQSKPYCLTDPSRQPCPLKCVCTFIWRVSHIIQNWPKE